MDIRCRPLVTFPVEFQAPRRSDPFSASWPATRSLLERELRHLGASNVVIELALTEADLRIDGWPRAGARTTHPGAVVSFDSHHGPLRYGTDAHPSWQANVRAIALGLESLRRVERYGIGRRGEQYVGWRSLPSGESPHDVVNRGLTLIEEAGSVRAARKAHHPDRGGNPEDFMAVQAAAKEVHGGG